MNILWRKSLLWQTSVMFKIVTRSVQNICQRQINSFTFQMLPMMKFRVVYVFIFVITKLIFSFHHLLWMTKFECCTFKCLKGEVRSLKKVENGFSTLISILRTRFLLVVFSIFYKTTLKAMNWKFHPSTNSIITALFSLA